MNVTPLLSLLFVILNYKKILTKVDVQQEGINSICK